MHEGPGAQYNARLEPSAYRITTWQAQVSILSLEEILRRVVHCQRWPFMYF
jgi:hypothetical protein